jgi:phosphopentomutase
LTGAWRRRKRLAACATAEGGLVRPCRAVKRRAFVIVLDACGAGELPDSADYGDAGANTLGHVAEASGGVELPVMQRLGLGSALPLVGCPPARDPVVHGRLRPQGPGKDTITGHWELMGAITPVALRTYPEGFPASVTDQLRDATGRGILCNRPYSGTAVIDDFGEEHLRSGDLIVYTSADSVLQIAAHEDVVSQDELYAACRAARAIMSGEHAVGRVIARPFHGRPGAFERTEGRKDFALDPPGRTYLDELQADGIPVHTVGKIGSVFNHVGVDHEHAGATNPAAIAATSALIGELEQGFVFTNLVETDQVYGHRNDVAGFHGALRAIDAAVREWVQRLDRERDLLVLTADHGCDPTMPGTDHTREHAPLVASFAGHDGRRHDGPFADVGASVLRWLAGREAAALPGTPFT